MAMAAVHGSSFEAFHYTQQSSGSGAWHSAVCFLFAWLMSGRTFCSEEVLGLYGYPESDGMTCREDDAAVALTSGTAFKRKVQAMCGRALPAAAPAQAPAAWQPSGCPPGRQGVQSVGAVAARPIGDFLNKIGEGIFVGTFRGEPFCPPNTAAGTNNRDLLQPSHNIPGLRLLRSQMFPGPTLCAPVCKMSLHFVAPILKRTSSHLHGMLSRTCTAHMTLGVA